MAGIVASALIAISALPVAAQKHVPKPPSAPRPPRPPVPRGNDLLLGSAVSGGVFAITASVAPVHVLPQQDSRPRRRPRSEHPRNDVVAHR